MLALKTTVMHRLVEWVLQRDAVSCSECPQKWAHRVCDSATEIELTLRHVTVLLGSMNKWQSPVGWTFSNWLYSTKYRNWKHGISTDLVICGCLLKSTTWSLPWETNGNNQHTAMQDRGIPCRVAGTLSNWSCKFPVGARTQSLRRY